MSRKKLVLCLGLSAILTASGFAADTGAIRIGAIFAITGPAANLGLPESRTLQMLVDDANAAGGIAGKKIELSMKDSQGNAEKALSFAKQLVEEQEVLAIIGPSTTGESMKLKGYCDENQTILISCAAAESIVSPVARWVFKTPQMDSFAAQMIFTTMKRQGISRIGVVVSNTGFGQGGKAQLEKLAPANGIDLAITEVYESTATDLTGVLTKIKAQNVQAVVNWSVEPAQSLVPKNMKQMGFEVPLFQSHGFGNINYVKMAGKAADQRHDVLAHQRFAAGEAQAADAARNEGGAQAIKLVEAQNLAFRQERLIFRHAIDAAEIAAIGHGHAQIGDRAGEGIDQRGPESMEKRSVHWAQYGHPGRLDQSGWT